MSRSRIRVESVFRNVFIFSCSPAPTRTLHSGLDTSPPWCTEASRRRCSRATADITCVFASVFHGLPRLLDLSCLRVFLATMTSHGNLISTPRVEVPFLCSLISYPAASWPPPVRRPHHDWKGALFSCRVNCRLKINGPIVVKRDMAERLNMNAVPGGIHGTTTWQCGFPT